jgi:hypothetical protein
MKPVSTGVFRYAFLIDHNAYGRYRQAETDTCLGSPRESIAKSEGGRNEPTGPQGPGI